MPSTETGLPWTLLVATDSASGQRDFENRRRLLTTGLAAIVLLLAGGGYVLWRLVQRELAVGRLQTEFVAAVSHEFRTPLTSLRHVTELLEEGDEMPRERRQSFYAVLGRNTERLHKLVESLLDFARMEDGRKPYDLQPVERGDSATTVVTDFTRDLTAGAPPVDLDLDDPHRSLVLADAASLAHALWNLLDNAVKYSPGGRPSESRSARTREGVAIAVHDQGLGIPAHERREIFGRFVRGKPPARLGIKGTGLGLAIVSHIADAHQRLDRARVGRRRREHIPARDSLCPGHRCGKHRTMARILIVEDEPDIVLSLEEDLRRQGHEASHAGDGERGLALAREGGWDLVLLDVMLPRMDGFDVCSELRKAGVDRADHHAHGTRRRRRRRSSGSIPAPTTT